ncbi:type VI secretion system baseplate subunit TssG [Bosea vaviloviae]|uniref:type VI secretion system baseplate subunit TssG n=1 Tax=Bosea vaviloviae TaxID=1526658 RepID=UPI000AAD5D21|nr:type VI secretion system baseplate subunit TssG [Bosea vaviloviae]
MSFLEDLTQEPWRFDFYETLRRLERANPKQPRIGDSSATREDYVALGQDPYMDFPASTLAKAGADATGRMRILVKFLGLLGPQGALPYATTEEVHAWLIAGDDAFPRFLDLFQNRFLQLFFRSWADARPVAQHDSLDHDRFFDFVGSGIGLGSAPYRGLDATPDALKASFSGLLGAQAKSAARLRGFLEGMFDLKVEIDEFVGMKIEFEESDRSSLGGRHARLGVDMLIGAGVFSIEDKIVVRLHTADLDEYRRFLPSGDICQVLNDAIFFVVGHEITWDIELSIPASKIEPMRLSRSGQLGWTSWLSPKRDVDADEIRCDARFQPGQKTAPQSKKPQKTNKTKGPS